MKTKIKEKLIKLRKWASGKKTITGIALHIAWGVTHLMVDAISSDMAINVHLGIGSLTGVGISSKLIKWLK